MTNDEIDKLEAGRELDRLVALNCGFTLVYDNGYDGEFKAELWPEEPKEFHPSTDWNDAMWAAEKIGLFGRLGNCLYQSVDGWMVLTENDADGPLSIHDSGPVAICRAILKASSK
jgi:hypothetical protein